MNEEDDEPRPDGPMHEHDRNRERQTPANPSDDAPIASNDSAADLSDETDNDLADATNFPEAAGNAAAPNETDVVDPTTNEADDVDEDEDEEDEETSSTAVQQLSAVAVILGIVAIVLCFIPKVPLTIALAVAIVGTVLGLVNCLSATVLHQPRIRFAAAGGTVIGALAIITVLFL
ncbi:hypothetical protein GFD17_00870 [Bifidobacterium sp. SMB2]|uniref:Uncharacterized protein n=1 Tax=Bifidobacterium saimiriisciurei TaxID=2661627 RepID=A0ABX0CCB6_9BIFI|nr:MULTISPECIES: Bax inhibitor-1/YccA family protein [Bifidobacterium]NEG95331.1 hypothetical protein [Bifidobacterium sp. SMB2]NEH11485.1 hypothetical protein [Bifidobacterium saimiriisciurei]